MKNARALFLLILLSFYSSVLCQKPIKKGDTKMILKSSVFVEGGMIPANYACDGKNISPPLHWEGVPQAAKSLALICDDPDAPAGTWVHWVVYDIAADVTDFAEAIPAIKILENGAKQGTNDFQKIGYGGPCPPGGTHHYAFKLYALDKKLNLEPGRSKAELLREMKEHIIAETKLTGLYKRR
jgi:Raf kinase inhibitor-like YbhB/YbcL family protein